MNTAAKQRQPEGSNPHWDLVISSESRWFDLKLRELWQYRDLLILLVRRDFVSFYKQTIFGPLWFFIQPLFTTLIYSFVFGNLAGLSTDGLPKPLFYMAGITPWNYFSECLVKTSTVFRDNAGLFGKVYFPRLIVPISIVVSNLTRFLIQFLLLVVLCFYFIHKGASVHPNRYIFLLPVLVLMMALLGLGTGMLISSMTTKYRDLAFLVGFGVQLLMYATTVVYPLSEAATRYPQFAWLFYLNPMTPIIETLRLGLLGQGTFSWQSFSLCSLEILAIALIGILVFNKVERNFIDTV